MTANSHNKIQVGISSCLLGHKVRFDAQHKEQRLITGKLVNKFDFVPVCPEVAIGLGVPRTPIHLVGDQHEPRAVNVRDESIDVSEKLIEFGLQKAQQLDTISGYIFKKGSPSCGLFNVKIYKSKTSVLSGGMGLYARQITNKNPLLPVEEEGRLSDPVLRHNFLQRVEVYHRWQLLNADGLSKNGLVQFHTRHKFMLLAHCEFTYRSLGPLVAQLGRNDLPTFAQEYITMLMSGLQKPTSRGKQTNVLEHLAGFIKGDLDRHDKQEMRQLIERYREGDVPLEALLTLLRHYFRKFPRRYVLQQYYLNDVCPEV